VKTPDWTERPRTPVASGIGGEVWRIALADGTPAAIKRHSSEALPERVPGEAFLRWRDDLGAARLMDTFGALSLYEWAGETTLHKHLLTHGDEAAATIARETIATLHSASPATPPTGLTPLAAHFVSLFEAAGRLPPEPFGGHLRLAADLAERLLSDQHDPKPLHGDIHHDNILSGPRGWLAIDPKGLFGDPAYDTANMFQNPVGSPLRAAPARIRALARTLAPAIQRDAQSVLDHALAYSGLSIAWWLEAADDEAALSTLEIGRAIAGVAGRA
jgi:streptomycin 6-kinase